MACQIKACKTQDFFMIALIIIVMFFETKYFLRVEKVVLNSPNCLYVFTNHNKYYYLKRWKPIAAASSYLKLIGTLSHWVTSKTIAKLQIITS